MAGNLTDTEENAVLDARLNGTVLRLFTADPGESGSVAAEVSGGGYAAQTITWSAASGGSKTNSADIVFPTATGSLGPITHIGISDTSSSALKWKGPLTLAKSLTTGDIFKVLAGSLVCSAD